MDDALNARPGPGDTVKLKDLPPGLIDNLPEEDQRAVAAMVGKPITLVEYDDEGRAELQFTDCEGVIHFIYVNPAFLTTV